MDFFCCLKFKCNLNSDLNFTFCELNIMCKWSWLLTSFVCLDCWYGMLLFFCASSLCCYWRYEGQWSMYTHIEFHGLLPFDYFDVNQDTAIEGQSSCDAQICVPLNFRPLLWPNIYFLIFQKFKWKNVLFKLKGYNDWATYQHRFGLFGLHINTYQHISPNKLIFCWYQSRMRFPWFEHNVNFSNIFQQLWAPFQYIFQQHINTNFSNISAPISA